MLLEIMKEINNLFINKNQIESGIFKIENNIINLKSRFLKSQYIAITGSILNNGIYLLNDTLYTLENAIDEEFKGIIYGLIVPKDFILLTNEIIQWIEKNPQSNVVSESFGAFSQSVALNKDGSVQNWKNVFNSRLNKYRKMFRDIDI